MQYNYLQHHGILGQKWGVRRYQNPDGTLTEAGRRRQNRIDKKAEKIEAKKQKRFDEAADKALARGGKTRLDKLDDDTKAAIKRAIQKSKNPEDLNRFKDLFDDTELRNIKNRIDLDMSVARLVPPTVTFGQQVINNMEKADKLAKTVSKFIEDGTKAWNGFASAYNAFVDDDEKIPVISSGKDKKKDKKKDDDDDDD